MLLQIASYSPSQLSFFFRKLFGSSCSLSCASADARLVRSSQCQSFVQPPLSVSLGPLSSVYYYTNSSRSKERKWNGVTDSICELPGAYTSVRKRYVFKKCIYTGRRTSHPGIVQWRYHFGAEVTGRRFLVRPVTGSASIDSDGKTVTKMHQLIVTLHSSETARLLNLFRGKTRIKRDVADATPSPPP